jgi:hypothetical protein
LTDDDRSVLRAFLNEPTSAIRYWMNPLEKGGMLYFDEIEGVILARRN